MNSAPLPLKLEKEMATYSSILAWRIPMDRGAWQATVHGVAKSWTRLKRLSTPLNGPEACLAFRLHFAHFTHSCYRAGPEGTGVGDPWYDKGRSWPLLRGSLSFSPRLLLERWNTGGGHAATLLRSQLPPLIHCGILSFLTTSPKVF